MNEFSLTEYDKEAIALITKIGWLLRERPGITPGQVNGLVNALYALQRLPEVTLGASTEFGIHYRFGDEDFKEMKYFSFRVSDTSLEITSGGSVYERTVGSDSYSEPSWYIELDGTYATRDCELYGIEDSIKIYLEEGAEIDVIDESEITYE